MRGGSWFVAVPVPAGDWLAPLVARLPAELRAVHPLDLHVTVAFLGACGEEAARRAFAQVDGAFAGKVRLGRIRGMGKPSSPSAWSVLLDDDGGLTDWIRARRDVAIAAAGAQPDRYDVLPHVTVARPARGATVMWEGADVGVEVELRGVVLMNGLGGRVDGRAYRVVEERRSG